MGAVWFLNPQPYIHSVIEARTVRLYWERPFLIHHRIDPHGMASLVLLGTKYEYLIQEDWGVTHFKEGVGQIATYTSWDYETDNLSLLEEMCEHPAGTDLQAIHDMNIPATQRPRLNQKHMIVLTRIPSASSNIIKKFYLQVQEMQEEFNVQFFIPRIISFRIGFGLGFAGCAMDPNEQAKHGNITLPSGRTVDGESIYKYPMWSRIFGHTPNNLIGSEQDRLAYNIASMLYSQDNYLKLMNPASRAPVRDITSPDAQAGLPQTKRITPLSSLAKDIKAGVRDKVNCDTCSLFANCKYAREGSVCGVPGSDGISLSTYFNTRDADRIVTGLGTLNGVLAKRLERKLNLEAVTEEDDPEVLKIAGMLFKQGADLAKLLDPNLRGGGTNLQVNVRGNGATQINSPNFAPNQLMAQMVAALEAQGIPRDKQTPAMIENLLKAMSAGDETKAREIEAVANSVDAVDALPDEQPEPNTGPF